MGYTGSHCEEDHRYDDDFLSLPSDQGGAGRHHCAGCAYDRGFALGENLEDIQSMKLDQLPYSQAGTVRHRSPHYAFALGYMEGVKRYYGLE